MVKKLFKESGWHGFLVTMTGNNFDNHFAEKLKR
jgi:hypothetical protein